MKSLIAATAAVTTLLFVGGCGRDWFDNEPKPDAAPTCSSPTYGEPLPVPPDDALDLAGRPVATPPGWGWIVFYLQVLGLASNGEFIDNRYCLPVDIHVFGRSSESDLTLLNPAGVAVQPQIEATVTPWFKRFVIQYDPTDERLAGRPPEYEVKLNAAYIPERGIRFTQDPAFPAGTEAAGLGCRIATDLSMGWSKETQAVAKDVGVFPTKTAVSCAVHGNFFKYS